MLNNIDKIASSLRAHLKVQNMTDSGIHEYANEIFKLAKRGYSHENLKLQIARIQVHGIEQPLDLPTCDKIAALAIDLAGTQ
jgi:hypothetical protein